MEGRFAGKANEDEPGAAGSGRTDHNPSSLDFVPRPEKRPGPSVIATRASATTSAWSVDRRMQP